MLKDDAPADDVHLLVLGLLVGEALSRPAARQHILVHISCFHNYSRRELSKLVADHVLSDPDIVVNLAVVDLEDQADEVGQDGGTTGLCLDRRGALAVLGAHNGQSIILPVRACPECLSCESMGPGSLRRRVGKS